MARHSQQLIEERYQKLPEELKQAIYGEDIALKIFDFGRKYGITIEKNGFLAEEIAYILLGLSKPEDFSKFIKERLDFDDEETTEIVKDVNQQILYPLRESLKRAHQMEIAEEKPVEAVVTKPPPPIVIPKPDTFPKIVPQEEVKKIKEEFRHKPFVQPITEEKLPAIPTPSPLATAGKEKILPIDLRQGVKPRPIPPEVIRGVIFAPPTKKIVESIPTAKPEMKITEPKTEVLETQTPEPKIQEQKPETKSISRSFDPYREPVE